MAISRRPDQKANIRVQAAKLFARNGYDATGIQELSEAVGLGRGALYHHIGSKEQLLFDIITMAVIDVVEEAEALLDEPLEPADKVRALSHLMMATVADNLAEWTVFFRELDALSGKKRREALEWRDRFEDVWAVVIEDGVERGDFRAMDPIVIKGILGIHNYAHVWLRRKGRLEPAEIADVFSEFVLTGLRRRD